jgi:lauroyl/myristoyl acyltransferase
MNTVPASSRSNAVPDMWHGPARLQPILPMLSHLPRPLGERILAGLAVADGVMRTERLRRARRWAAARSSGLSSWRMALALLANHGRFTADEAMLGVSSLDQLGDNVVIEGAEQLATSGAALLLGFHLGPPLSWLVLNRLGHHVRFAGRLEAAAGDRRWDALVANGDVIRLPQESPRERTQGLLRMRRLLGEGARIYVTGDGPFGREAFRIELPGGPLILRTGWWSLRRHTNVPTLPVLAHRDGPRRVITIYPPLPPCDNDAERDVAQCRAALEPIIDSYVRRFPEQCRYLALPPWDTAA